MPTHNKIAHPHLSRQHAQKPCRKLKIGNPAAHEKIRLMLLGSPPDMVHGISLRKTDLSTPLTRYGWHITPDRVWGFIPALADCRYRAPLTPRLVRPCYKPAAHTRTIFCFRESLNKSARAGSEGFCSQARDGKWRNTLCTRKGYAASVSQLMLATAAQYFPFFIPRHGDKRPAVQPQAIYSEVP